MIPCYNSEAYIADTLKSIKEQTFQDYEVILVDDHSTDNSLKIALQTFRDLQITGKAQLRNTADYPKGVSGCRNNGIDLAEGQWICFLDSDDLFVKEKLEKTHLRILEHPEIQALHHGVREFEDETGKALCDVVFPTLEGVHEKMPELLDRNYICTSTVTLKKALLLSIGKFNKTLNGIEDYYCWMSVSKRTPWHYSSQILTSYRVRKESLMGFRPLPHYLAQNASLLKVVKSDPLFSKEEYTRLEHYLMQDVLIYYINNSVNKFGMAKTYKGLLKLLKMGYAKASIGNAVRITRNHLFKKIFK